MTTETAGSEILGRGARDGARLFREWYLDLSKAPERGEKTAYVFVMGSLAEFLRSFGFNVSFPEINALQTAVRKVEMDFLNPAEEYGYSPDICAYVRVGVGIQLRNEDHPMGRVPKPDLGIATNACNTYIKWAEIWERFYNTPVFTLDVPGRRAVDRLPDPGDSDFESDRRYVEAQLRELIPLCEKITGTKFDIDRLRETLGETNRMNAAWRRVLELNASTPAVYNAVGEGTIYLGVVNALRGDVKGTRYFEELAEELSYKAANGIGGIEQEKHRLIFVGVPCYPIFRRFNEMFTGHGGVFVGSTYLWFASGGFQAQYMYDLKNPIESLAEGLLLQVGRGMSDMFFVHTPILEMVKRLHADGVVFHPIKSCRTVSSGLADGRRLINELSGISSLYIESDLVDRRVVSEAQMKNRVDAFFEALDARKLRGEAAHKAA